MIRRITFFFYLSVILLAPLPFASNRPWSWSLLSALIGVCLILEAITARENSEASWSFLKRMSPGLILWLGVGLWIWLQSAAGMPDTWVHPLWSEASRIIGRPTEATISIDPMATRTALMRFLAYGGVFWISARFCRDVELAARTLKAFVVVSLLYALYGLVIFFSGLEMILWFEKWAYRGDLVSTFVNRNSYATFAGLGLIASIGLTFDLIGTRLAGYLTPRELWREFFEAVSSRAWIPFLAVIVTATALLLTHSRGGFLSTALAMLVLLAAVSQARLIPRQIGYTIFGLILVGSSFAFTMSGDIVVRRLEQTSLETSIRDDLYQRVTEAILSNPFLGTGYGTFEEAFRLYKTPILLPSNWDKAHNSYLELALELGWPATIAIMAAFVWLVGVCLYGLVRRRRNKVYAAIGLAATILVAAHALVDFSLQIPGFTVCYAMLAGMAWAQSWPTRRRKGVAA